MRVLVVVNRFATGHDPAVTPVLAAGLRAHHDVEVVETAHRGHGVELARDAMRAGVDAVIAYGGDGTVNELVNGLLADGPHAAVPQFGVVPAGSTNVFARALGLPNRAGAAAERLTQALRTGSSRAVSMGQADDRWFCFSAGLGFDAAVVHGVEAQRNLGKKSTHVLYARVGLRAFFDTERETPHIRVKLADGTTLAGVHFAIVTNCDPWTFVGPVPLRPTPHTDFDTGLGLYARRRMGAPGMLYSMGAMMGRPARVGDRGAYLVEDLDRLDVLADAPLPFQIDGDAVDHRDRVSLRSVPRALRVAL
jgi:diacylglycerol kinase family enzyme